MTELDSNLEGTFASFELAVPLKPVDSSIIYSFSNVESHIETTVICLCESQADFSFVLIHFRYLQKGVFLFELIRVHKHLLVSHEVRAREGFLFEQIGQNFLESFTVLRVNSIPHFRLTLVKKIYCGKIKIFNVPVKKGPPSTNKEERSVKSMYFFSDNIREKGLKVGKIPLACVFVHQWQLDIRAIKLIVKSI